MHAREQYIRILLYSAVVLFIKDGPRNFSPTLPSTNSPHQLVGVPRPQAFYRVVPTILPLMTSPRDPQEDAGERLSHDDAEEAQPGTDAGDGKFSRSSLAGSRFYRYIVSR